MRACAPETFACNGHTPGFWSNKNGCAELTANPLLYSKLNAFLGTLDFLPEGVTTPVETCDQVDGLLKVDAVPMTDKLLAMWTAFLLTNWNFWSEDCFDRPITFDFPVVVCETTLTWPSAGEQSFDSLEALVTAVYNSGSACEQEALKDFLDAANNSEDVCLCDCPSGATGGESGGFGE